MKVSDRLGLDAYNHRIGNQRLYYRHDGLTGGVTLMHDSTDESKLIQNNTTGGLAKSVQRERREGERGRERGREGETGREREREKEREGERGRGGREREEQKERKIEDKCTHAHHRSTHLHFHAHTAVPPPASVVLWSQPQWLSERTERSHVGGHSCRPVSGGCAQTTGLR